MPAPILRRPGGSASSAYLILSKRPKGARRRTHGFARPLPILRRASLAQDEVDVRGSARLASPHLSKLRLPHPEQATEGSASKDARPRPPVGCPSFDALRLLRMRPVFR